MSVGGSLPTCPHCGLVALDGGPCGRDECPGEATRQRATFGAPPEPRRPADWKRRTGLRLERGGVREIDMEKPSCVALAQVSPEVMRYRASLLDEMNGRSPPYRPSRLRRLRSAIRERWVSMWARIAQCMGVDLDG